MTSKKIKLKLSFSQPKAEKKVCWSTRDNYGDIKIKEYSKVAYLDCELDKNLSGEAKALKIIKKFDRLRLRFLFSKNRYLSLYLKRLLWNAIIQPHFDYDCSNWCSNLNKKFKCKLRSIQNKWIRFCLYRNSRSHIGVK